MSTTKCAPGEAGPAPNGPPLEMRIAREDVVREFEQHGFRVSAEHTFLPNQYFLVFTVAGAAPVR